MDWETAIREPSVLNYGFAVLSTAADIVGGSAIKGGIKTYKAYKAFKAAEKVDEAAAAARVGAERAYRAGKMKKAKRLTGDATKLEGKSRTLRNDTRVFGMGEAPKFYDAFEVPIYTSIAGSLLNSAELGIGALQDRIEQDSVKNKKDRK